MGIELQSFVYGLIVGFVLRCLLEIGRNGREMVVLDLRGERENHAR